MAIFSKILSVLVTAAVVAAQHDTGAHLTKPTLHSNLDYLKSGLIASLPETQFKIDQWGAGWIPQGCKNIAEGKVESSVTYNPADFNIFNVHYSDCGDAWVFCHHKNSPITIHSMAKQFGKVPIQMRQWVRHVVDVPAKAGWAFEYDGIITFVNPQDNMLPVILHETSHSLDLSGAYKQKPMSSSDVFWNAYNADSNTPDPYSQSNIIEDVAQNSVVAIFDSNVSGGFHGVEPKSAGIKHQYQTLQAAAEAVGHGNSLFKPGQNAQCTHRMPNSETVSVNGKSKRNAGVHTRRVAPGKSLAVGIKPIDTSSRKNKRSNCNLRW